MLLQRALPRRWVCLSPRNTVGSYRCFCKEPYQGDGFACRLVTQLDPIGASAKSLTKEMGLPVASEVSIGFGTTAGTDESLRHI